MLGIYTAFQTHENVFTALVLYSYFCFQQKGINVFWIATLDDTRFKSQQF